jgi:hypothetical protein
MSETEKIGASPTPAREAKDPSQIEFLDAAQLTFRTVDGRLRVKMADDDWQDSGIARLFPLSEPEKWLSVLDKDAKETGILLDMKGLDHQSVEAVRDELRRRYLVPQIERIISTRDRFDMVEWTVETDRGAATFLTRRAHETAQRPIERRLVLTDVGNNRYDIPDVGELDPASRALLEERL